MPSSTSGETHVDSRIFNNDSIETFSSTSGETLVDSRIFNNDSIENNVFTGKKNYF